MNSFTQPCTASCGKVFEHQRNTLGDKESSSICLTELLLLCSFSALMLHEQQSPLKADLLNDKKHATKLKRAVLESLVCHSVPFLSTSVHLSYAIVMESLSKQISCITTTLSRKLEITSISEFCYFFLHWVKFCTQIHNNLNDIKIYAGTNRRLCIFM